MRLAGRLVANEYASIDTFNGWSTGEWSENECVPERRPACETRKTHTVISCGLRNLFAEEFDAALLWISSGEVVIREDAACSLGSVLVFPLQSEMHLMRDALLKARQLLRLTHFLTRIRNSICTSRFLH